MADDHISAQVLDLDPGELQDNQTGKLSNSFFTGAPSDVAVSLTSLEILDAVSLASAAYSDSPEDMNQNLNYLAEREGSPWTNVTGELTQDLYGLDTSYITWFGGVVGDAGFFHVNTDQGQSVDNPGSAEAYLFRNEETGQYALAFRGTEPDSVWLVGGDNGDWLERREHYDAFEPLIDAVENYLAVKGDQAGGQASLLVTGHSLGGAMVEYFMADHGDGSTTLIADDGTEYTSGISYEAVAIASPDATYAPITDPLRPSDPRVLNIGHENDFVFGASIGDGRDDDTDVMNFFVDEGSAHKIETTYMQTISTLLMSQFYGETDNTSRVVVSLAETFAEAIENYDSSSIESLILGRDQGMTRTDEVSRLGPNYLVENEISADDILVGYGGQDSFEGFAGDDLIIARSNGNTISGGAGEDTILLESIENFAGTTFVDLNIGDRIVMRGEDFDANLLAITEGGFDISSQDGATHFVTANFEEGATLMVVEERAEIAILDDPNILLTPVSNTYLEVVSSEALHGDGPDHRENETLVGLDGEQDGVVSLVAPTFISDGEALSEEVELSGAGRSRSLFRCPNAARSSTSRRAPRSFAWR